MEVKKLIVDKKASESSTKYVEISPGALYLWVQLTVFLIINPKGHCTPSNGG